ncbi:MAG: hypothetical protein ACK4VI_03035 [Alphaproteobacteria bacterium]
MDDKDNKSVKKPPQPIAQKAAQKTHAPRNTVKSKKKKSRKLDPTAVKLIGIFVLALGVASFIAVSYLALIHLGLMERAEGQQAALATNHQNQVSEAQRAALEQHVTIASTAKVAEATQTQINSLGLKKADINTIQRTWVSRHRIMTALADFKNDGSFEIILFTDANGFERYYVRGNYVYDDKQGILTMQAGHDPVPRIDGVIMRSLTSSTFNVVLLQQGNQLIWVPHILQGHRNQVHPLFTFFEARDSYIVWSEDRR